MVISSTPVIRVVVGLIHIREPVYDLRVRVEETTEAGRASSELHSTLEDLGLLRVAVVDNDVVRSGLLAFRKLLVNGSKRTSSSLKLVY